MTYHKDVAVIRDLTGFQLHLQPFESVIKATIQRDGDSIVKMSLRVSRIRGKESRGRFVVTERGVQLYVWTPDEKNHFADQWLRDSQTFWEPATDEEIILRGHVLTPKEVADQREWETICHRPGSARFPQDNLDRIRQDVK